MRDYAKVAPQFWTGTTGRALKKAGAEAVIVGMYLMTSPHANMIGVYYCPLTYIAHDTGLDTDGAWKGLQSSIEAGFCTYDEASEYVFVHEFAQYQIGEQLDPKDKRVQGVINELAKVPKTQCWQGFRARYAVPFCLPIESQPPSPIEAPSEPLPSQKQEQKQEQKEKQPTVAPARPDERPALALVGNPGPPDCPHLEVLALWAEVLPALPQHLPAQWKGTRADHLRARWRETAVEKAWADQSHGLAYLRKLFEWIGRSQFLTGRARPTGADKRAFVIELEWLVLPTNWAKVIEGKYHAETA